MKEKLQTKFATRQYMISDTFELYYYSTIDVPGVKEHTHTHYEFYLFLEGRSHWKSTECSTHRRPAIFF